MLKILSANRNDLIIGEEELRISGFMPGVELLNRRLGAPDFINIGEKDAVLADVEGTVLSQVSLTDQVEITRRIFSAGNQNMVAVQLIVQNKCDHPIFIDKVSLMKCQGNQSVYVGGEMKDFRCLKLGRHKLDVPTVFHPSVVDDSYRDAAFQAHKLRAGLGVQGNTQDYYSMDKIYSEPVFFIKNDRRADIDGIGMCVLGQERHLTSFIFSPSEDKKSLKEFEISLEFDGICLQPEETQNTHWIVFYTAKEEQEAIWKYRDLLASHYHIAAPTDKFSLYCSWYFYGREFYEKDLIENVKILKEKNIPVDAFIIDNGWMDRFGDYNANGKFPSGMAKMADIIGNAGYSPGIWTCPFMMMKDSEAYRKHPELAAKNRDGSDSMFHYIEGDCHIVDPTHPYCEEFFGEIYGRLNSWGYQYHKMDFMRAPTVNDEITFFDHKYNRASAYRKGHELLRKAIGPDRYFLSCGGIYDSGTLEIVDSVRSGSDSVGSWMHPFAGREGSSKIQVKQAMFRNYLNQFYNLDPDSLMLRRRKDPYQKQESPVHDILSNGLFDDNEARIMVAKQYLCGGNVNFSERMVELPEDRLKLLSTIIPPVTGPAKILDYQHEDTPTLALTEVKTLDNPYYTLNVFNWKEEEEERVITLEDLSFDGMDSKGALFEFFTQEFLGVVDKKQEIRLIIPAHGVCCIRITPIHGEGTYVIGTDSHMSMGGYELTNLSCDQNIITGHVQTKWGYPVKIAALNINKDGNVLKIQEVKNKTDFEIIF